MVSQAVRRIKITKKADRRTLLLTLLRVHVVILMFLLEAERKVEKEWSLSFDSNPPNALLVHVTSRRTLKSEYLSL